MSHEQPQQQDFSADQEGLPSKEMMQSVQVDNGDQTTEDSRRREAVAEASQGLMQRLARMVEQKPSLKIAVVLSALLGPAQKAQAGFFEDAVQIVAESVGRSVGQEVESAERSVRSGVDRSVYDSCRKIDNDTMRQICYDALPRIVDRAVEAARNPASGHPTTYPTSVPRGDRGIVWE